MGKQWQLWLHRFNCFDIPGDDNFLYRFPNLYQLCCACLGVCLQLAPFSPLISWIVMIHIAQEQTFGCLMNDYPQITTYPHRPEVFVPGFIELMETHTRISR